MFELVKNYSLKNHNTFGIDVKAKSFFSFDDELDLIHLLKVNNFTANDILTIGEGSNILFSGDYDGLVVFPCNKSIEVLQEDDDVIYVRVGAGYNWDDFVHYCVDKGWGGIENLSNIPGNVGASPVQNIGAYGVEVGNFIHSVDLVNIETAEQEIFLNSQCEFGYRDSVFKNKYKNLFIVTHVVFELFKNHIPVLSYDSLEQKVLEFGEINIENVRKAVISIRNAKLPDPNVIGNAGSFFKNPVVSREVADMLRKQYSNIPEYILDSGEIKLAAGWLIDKCGYKGFRRVNVGVHVNQALVIVNFGGASGMDIILLANEIKNAVFSKFGIMLELEVKVV